MDTNLAIVSELLSPSGCVVGISNWTQLRLSSSSSPPTCLVSVNANCSLSSSGQNPWGPVYSSLLPLSRGHHLYFIPGPDPSFISCYHLAPLSIFPFLVLQWPFPCSLPLPWPSVCSSQASPPCFLPLPYSLPLPCPSVCSSDSNESSTTSPPPSSFLSTSRQNLKPLTCETPCDLMWLEPCYVLDLTAAALLTTVALWFPQTYHLGVIPHAAATAWKALPLEIYMWLALSCPSGLCTDRPSWTICLKLQSPLPHTTLECPLPCFIFLLHSSQIYNTLAVCLLPTSTPL